MHKENLKPRKFPSNSLKNHSLSIFCFCYVHRNSDTNENMGCISYVQCHCKIHVTVHLCPIPVVM